MQIKVREFGSRLVYPAMAEVSAMLDELCMKNQIEMINWEGFQYKPDVQFAMAYGLKEIYLKYYVKESHTKAEKSKINEMVCEDSCVEFFVSPGDDGIYYNFEFNPIGTIHLGCGTGRHDRIRIDSTIAGQVRTLGSMGTTPFAEISGDNSWTLTVAIPLEVFIKHKIDNMKGMVFHANFYKCGDRLTTPHYVTWNPVKTDRPDYHRPEYFGKIIFI
ncbi:MAG TPA: carbohydrate-binding family 9-like protein [Bacteroidales bacterium]|nr:carbohydrate-binding family 9-like protein [Bacteroidales bacterium]HPT11505.1 carbohydrate-binding family 9-like protein [Bacteroidales bacterium]